MRFHWTWMSKFLIYCHSKLIGLIKTFVLLIEINVFPAAICHLTAMYSINKFDFNRLINLISIGFGMRLVFFCFSTRFQVQRTTKLTAKYFWAQCEIIKCSLIQTLDKWLLFKSCNQLVFIENPLLIYFRFFHYM